MSKEIDISTESSYFSFLKKYINDYNAIELCEFFQYKTANDADSPLSFKLDKILSDDQKKELFSLLLKEANATNEDFIFNSLLRNKIEDIRSLNLSDTTLKCDKVKGFFHQNNPSTTHRSQLEIDSMLKHIRNSFAHGRISFNDAYLILEDKRKELTGRLIITVDVLKKWKLCIESYLNTMNEKENNNHVNLQM